MYRSADHCITGVKGRKQGQKDKQDSPKFPFVEEQLFGGIVHGREIENPVMVYQAAESVSMAVDPINHITCEQKRDQGNSAKRATSHYLRKRLPVHTTATGLCLDKSGVAEEACRQERILF